MLLRDTEVPTDYRDSNDSQASVRLPTIPAPLPPQEKPTVTRTDLTATFRRRTRRPLIASLVITSLVAGFSPLVAQEAATVAAPQYEWSVAAGGAQHDKVRGIALDSDGNVLLTGEFTGEATFGDLRAKAVGSMDFFVAKVSPSGKFLWVRTGGGDKIDRGYAIAVDPSGNSYVTGHYESATAQFDGQQMTSVGDYDLFVAKYDPQGKLLWLRTGGGAGYDYGHGIAADKLGNVFVTGAVVGDAQFANTSLGHPGPAHVFCLRMAADGAVRWARTAEGKGASSGHGIAADQQGNCYVGGYAAGNSLLGGRVISTPVGHDLLVAKFNRQGELVWLHEGHGSSNAMIHEITADAAGNVWAVGMFRGALKLGDREVSNHGEHDLLLTSFDASGKRLWTKTAGGPGIDYGLGVATDGQGNSFMTGSFTGRVEFDGTLRETMTPAADIMVVSYDRGGSPRWFERMGSERTDHAYTIVSDGRGALTLSGACSGAARFGTFSLPSLGSNDIFLTRLRSAPGKEMP